MGDEGEAQEPQEQQNLGMDEEQTNQETTEVTDAEVVQTTEEERDSDKNYELAREVINGEWGTGQDRRKRLSDAGHDAQAVEDAVTDLRNRNR